MTTEHITAYLLGELSEEESERFEDECFAAEDWPVEVELAEEDLVDDYLRDRLPPAQRRDFEQNYLTTAARVERVRMASALLRHVDEQPEPAAEPAPEPAPVRPPGPSMAGRFRAFWGGRAWVPAAAAFAVLAVVALGWWATRPREPRTFATLTLAASAGDRAEGVRAGRVDYPLAADALKVSLTLPEGAAPGGRYRAELESEDGGSEPVEASGPEAGVVSVSIPAARLRRGSYALKLYAARPDGREQRIPGSYFFTVE